MAAGTIGTRAGPMATPRPASARPRHDAAGRFQAEGGAAGEHHRIDGGDRLFGGKQVGVARARRPAHDMARGDGRFVAEHHRDARLEAGVVGIADTKAGERR